MTTIGTSLVITGEVTSKEDITIHGQVKGQISMVEGTLLVAPTARIEADVAVTSVTIHGNMSGKVAAAIARVLADTPLFVKIGYLEEPLLAKFVRHNRAYVRGIVAINTISMSVVSPSGAQVFPGSGRGRAGISGVAIRPWAHEVVRNLVAIREQEKAENELAIIAVGGVNTSRDIYDYLNLGADAVESCTAAYLNPYLAIETRLQLSKLKGNREVS